MGTYFISGEHNVTCDVCSKKIKSNLARKRWDGFIVCPDDFEQRHPQDFIRGKEDHISVPFSRPIPPLVFTSVTYQLYVADDYVVINYIQESI